MWAISLQPLTTFTNRSLLDVRQGSEYASVSVFTVGEPIFHEISGNIDPESILIKIAPIHENKSHRTFYVKMQL